MSNLMVVDIVILIRVLRQSFGLMEPMLFIFVGRWNFVFHYPIVSHDSWWYYRTLCLFSACQTCNYRSIRQFNLNQIWIKLLYDGKFKMNNSFSSKSQLHAFQVENETSKRMPFNRAYLCNRICTGYILLQCLYLRMLFICTHAYTRMQSNLIKLIFRKWCFLIN